LKCARKGDRQNLFPVTIRIVSEPLSGNTDLEGVAGFAETSGQFQRRAGDDVGTSYGKDGLRLNPSDLRMERRVAPVRIADQIRVAKRAVSPAIVAQIRRVVEVAGAGVPIAGRLMILPQVRLPVGEIDRIAAVGIGSAGVVGAVSVEKGVGAVEFADLP